MGKRKQKFIPRIGKAKAEYKEDKTLLQKLCRLVLLALEIADLPKDEAEAVQKKFLDGF